MKDSNLRTVAFFDFDGTLAMRDSLWPFLVAARGLPRCLWAGFLGVLAYLATPPGDDRRSAIKDTLLRHALRGVEAKTLGPAIEKMKNWPVWIETSCTALKKHHAAGDLVVIATGSLDLYMPALLKEILPYDELICTRMESKGGVLTGRMVGGNCVRGRKAERVAAYLAAHGPFADVWAYGNAPHDLPMMALAHHRVVIGPSSARIPDRS